MKKSMLMIAAMVAAMGMSSAWACNGAGCTSVSSSSGSYAGSSGNGAAFNSSGGFQYATTNVDGNVKSGQVGGLQGQVATVGGAATGGTAYSVSGSVGNAGARGDTLGIAEACVTGSESFKVDGRNGTTLLTGYVSGSAQSSNINWASTFANGNGFAAAGNASGNVSGFSGMAAAGGLYSNYVGAGAATTQTNAFSTSLEAGNGVVVGNAGYKEYSNAGGDAGIYANSYAKTGVCGWNGC